MKIETKSRLLVFILCFFIWAALTNIWDLQEVTAGLILSSIVTLIAGQFLLKNARTKSIFFLVKTWIKYFLVFLREMIKANLNVAAIVIHPKLPIKPGIVKIKTGLTSESALTVLANSITLTPGTMTVDINPEKHELYIHWIRVVSANPHDVEENTKIISSVFEKTLLEVLG
jgi:multicomponent Na+:H+ antiporter subunit E